MWWEWPHRRTRVTQAWPIDMLSRCLSLDWAVSPDLLPNKPSGRASIATLSLSAATTRDMHLELVVDIHPMDKWRIPAFNTTVASKADAVPTAASSLETMTFTIATYIQPSCHVSSRSACCPTDEI